MSTELVELLAAQLEFDYVYVLSEDNKFGSPEANGSWNGLIKMLLEGVSEVDELVDEKSAGSDPVIIPYETIHLILYGSIKPSADFLCSIY